MVYGDPTGLAPWLSLSGPPDFLGFDYPDPFFGRSSALGSFTRGLQDVFASSFSPLLPAYDLFGVGGDAIQSMAAFEQSISDFITGADDASGGLLSSTFDLGSSIARKLSPCERCNAPSVPFMGPAGYLGLGAAARTSFARVMDTVDRLDFSTAANRAVFYSGPGQGARAVAFAERTGAMTIEMTSGGRALAGDPLFQSLAPAEQFQIWQRASTPFAQGASGTVNLFINGARPAGTFRTIEEPILRASSNVYRYIYHY